MGLRRELRRWKKGRGDGKGYKERKGNYNKLCKEKKREENERWLREVEKAKTEDKVWEIINKCRRRWKRVNEGIEMGEWKEFFIGLLGVVEWRMMRGQRCRRERDEESEIRREEFKRVLRELKAKKAMGEDKMLNEI